MVIHVEVLQACLSEDVLSTYGRRAGRGPGAAETPDLRNDETMKTFENVESHGHNMQGGDDVGACTRRRFAEFVCRCGSEGVPGQVK